MMRTSCFLRALHLNQNLSSESIRICSLEVNVFLVVAAAAATVLFLLLLPLVFLRGVAVDCFYSPDSIDASQSLRVRADEIFAVL